VVAALLGAREVEALAQHVEDGRAHVDVQPVVFSVDAQDHVHEAGSYPAFGPITSRA
jgi:hypothetical protein